MWRIILGVLLVLGSLAHLALDSIRFCTSTLGCVEPADPIEWPLIATVIVLGVALIVWGWYRLRRGENERSNARA